MSRSTRYISTPAPGLSDLVVFDGVCNLCSWWVGFVLARDPDTRFSFVSIQSRFGREIATRFGVDPDDPETNITILGGTAHFKLESAMAVLGTLPGWGGVARLGRWLPRPLADWLYDGIARNRYRLFGRKASCMVPTADVAQKFLSERP